MASTRIIFLLILIVGGQTSYGYPAWKCICGVVDCYDTFIRGKRELIANVNVRNVGSKQKDQLELVEAASDDTDILQAFKVSHGKLGTYYFWGTSGYRLKRGTTPTREVPDGVTDVIRHGGGSVTITKQTKRDGVVEFLYEYDGDVPFSAIAAHMKRKLEKQGYFQVDRVLLFTNGPIILFAKPTDDGGVVMDLLDLQGTSLPARTGDQVAATQRFLIRTLAGVAQAELGKRKATMLHPLLNE